jgi:hypothetical protein
VGLTIRVYARRVDSKSVRTQNLTFFAEKFKGKTPYRFSLEPFMQHNTHAPENTRLQERPTVPGVRRDLVCEPLGLGALGGAALSLCQTLIEPISVNFHQINLNLSHSLHREWIFQQNPLYRFILLTHAHRARLQPDFALAVDAVQGTFHFFEPDLHLFCFVQH